jgi:hypothetical protein
MDTRRFERFCAETERSLRAYRAEEKRGRIAWALPGYTGGIAFQGLGALCWFATSHGAAALATTLFLFNLSAGLRLALQSRRYASMAELSGLPDQARYHAYVAWRRLALVQRMRCTTFSNLCAGMCWIPFLFFALTTGTRPALWLTWVAIAAAFGNMLMVAVFRDAFAVQPLIARLLEGIKPPRPEVRA